LDDRKAKGFNVVQGVIALWDANTYKNPDGQLPFVDRDLGKINVAFYKNVDSILDKVQAHGMYMAVLPYWHKNAGDRLGAEGIPEKMEAYCKFLAERYAKRNVFWILGGDSTAAGEAGVKIQHVTDLEAQGLIDGAKAVGVDKIMISYHPTGSQSSSFWFQERPWLDFNSIQSGHFIDTHDFQIVAKDYAKTPVKPTLDMEPGYENITDRLVGTPGARRIQAVDVRRSAYLDVFAGTVGLTYGQGEVYGFAKGGSVTTRWGTAMSWKEALKLPASGQVQFIRDLIESRPELERVPDQDLIVGDNSARAVEHFAAMRGSDGTYAFVYIPANKQTVTVNTKLLSGATLRAWWYDPRMGTASQIDEAARTDSRQFTAPSVGPDDDWVLVLDDAAKNYPAPGTRMDVK
ncbi:MAG: glycoside hydrolase family 140 protein, partial [Tepidisphaeraceae bacterium]